MPPLVLPLPTRCCQTIAPLLSGSSPHATPDFCPMAMMLRPLGSVRSTGELPKSKSGPCGSGHVSDRPGPVDGHDPVRNASFGVTCLTHTWRPLFRSIAITASDSSAAGDVYASPVATYRTPRRGSIVGDDQIAAPAGPHIWVPIEVFFVFASGFAIVSLFQICSPVAPS